MDSGEEAASTSASEAQLGESRLNNGKRAKHSPAAQPPLSCPNCGSERVWKDGFHYNNGRPIQRYLCRLCGFRFSQSEKGQVKVHVSSKPFKTSDSMADLGSFKSGNGFSPDHSFNDSALSVREDVASHGPDSPFISTVGKALKPSHSYYRNRQVCAPEREAKNLAAAIESQKWAAGTTSEAKAGLIEFAWWLKKQGYKDATIENIVKLLKVMAKRGADLLNPESVKDVIARQTWSEGRKENAVDAYTLWLSFKGGSWNPPVYKRVRKLPFIPTEQELDSLIASCGPKTATFLQLLKETGMRAGEAWQLKWTDLDVEAKAVRVTPEKGSEPRILRISNKLLAMLSALPKENSYIFGGYPIRGFARSFQRQRLRASRKFGNPRLLQISFHTFRHWKATMEYAKTKDIFYVMKLLGHKNIKNTLVYTQLVNFKEDEFIFKVAKNVDEAGRLIEAGFEYVCHHEGVMLFRKRK